MHAGNNMPMEMYKQHVQPKPITAYDMYEEHLCNDIIFIYDNCFRLNPKLDWECIHFL